MCIQFEWDENKRRETLEKRGIDFADAPVFFSSRVFLAPDDRIDYGEERLKALGLLHGKVVVAVMTPRNQAWRIISMRLANRKERRAYAELLEKA